MDHNEGDEGFGGGVGNGAPQDDNRLYLDRGRAVNDARQRFVASYIWQLPVGQGMRFLDRGGVVNTILGGWELSGITSYQSGFPFTVESGSDYSNTGSSNARPDRTCTGNGQHTINNWFDKSCFTTSALSAALDAGTPRFGNAGRNILTGPAFHNWDLALLKHFQVTERVKLEFRAETYNTFNFVAFGAPNSVVGNPNEGKLGGAGQPRDIQFGLKLSF